LSGGGKARAFLLQSSPGTRMLEHTHTGSELTCVLNNLNRSMGLQDAYPFVLSTAALEKLRFVHELVAGAR
jgi:hypothetical protein